MLQGNISVTITLTQGETPRNLAAYPYHMKKERSNGRKASSETIKKTATFEELFLPHLDGAHNLARWIVERDPDAEAVVQEAYIQASSAFVEFREADARGGYWRSSGTLPTLGSISVAVIRARKRFMWHRRTSRSPFSATKRGNDNSTQH